MDRHKESVTLLRHFAYSANETVTEITKTNWQESTVQMALLIGK